MNEYVENGDVSVRYGYMNSRTLYQKNGLKSLINYNNSYDIEMNSDVW